MTNPNGSLDPRSLLPGQDDDWVMYPLDEFAVTTVTEVITGLVGSAGIDLDLKPADLMSNLNARTDPNADPMVAKEAAADKPSPFRLKPGVFFHAPRLLFKVLRHDPARWQREERSFRNRIKLFKHRTAQAGSLSDKELARLAEDIVDLFRTCLHDGAMYYGLGLVWMYWRTARLLRKRSNAGGELTENVAAYFLQLLLTDQKNPLSPLFEQFRKLSADTQEVDLQAFVVSIPDSAFMTANTSRDIEKAIFKKLRALPKGQQIETQVDALLADLPVAPEAAAGGPPQQRTHRGPGRAAHRRGRREAGGEETAVQETSPLEVERREDPRADGRGGGNGIPAAGDHPRPPAGVVRGGTTPA